MADNFITLYNRLLNRAPQVGVVLAKQFINDSWHSLQARREWSFRRRSNTFAPPDIYTTGTASTNVAQGIGNPAAISGTNTNWTVNMIGRQIRVGGLLYPFYTIIAVISPTLLYIDQPWAGPDVSNLAYTILQAYYPVPSDFGSFYAAVSIKDGFRLWTNITQADLAMLDPQRTNFGQTYAVAFRDYQQQSQNGVVGQAMPFAGTSGLPPTKFCLTTTDTGFTFPVPLSYIITITTGGINSCVYSWQRMPGAVNNTGIASSPDPLTLEYGVQIFWPPDPTNTYIAGQQFLIQCFPSLNQQSVGVPRYELWPAPTFSGYLYPYIYIAKEYDLSDDQPMLPPFVANRGEVLLEMALEKCAEYPGPDADHPNVYHDLRQAGYHAGKVRDMLIDLERNDEEVGVSLIDYQVYPYAPAPWLDGQWQQQHAPYLLG